jgi:thiol-disulfide isomerase/thioredoxin
MNKKVKVLIGVVIFILVLIACYIAYNSLATKDNLPITASLDEPSVPPVKTDTADSDKTTGSTGSKGVANEDPDENTGYVPIEAPNFTVQDPDGNAVELNDLKGKPIVLNFWASWCPPCIKELPIFDEVYQELGDELTFVMVDLTNDRESIKDGKAYIAEHNLTFPVYFDVSGDGGATYQITSIPTTFFINADGFIETGVVGGIDRATLEKGISYIYE